MVSRKALKNDINSENWWIPTAHWYATVCTILLLNSSIFISMLVAAAVVHSEISILQINDYNLWALEIEKSRPS